MAPQHIQLESFLRGIGLSDSTVREVLPLFHPETYKKDDYFSTIHGKIRLGFICSGCFYMYSISDLDEVHVKNFLGPGEFMLPGFDPALCSGVNICALTDSTVLTADYRRVQELADRNPEFQKASRIGIEKNFQKICTQLQNIKTLPARKSYELFKKEFSSLYEQIPQYLIASYLGITPTQLSRIRKKVS